jgi:hypothetical protein
LYDSGPLWAWSVVIHTQWRIVKPAQKEMQQKLHKHAETTHRNSQQKDVKLTTYLASKLNV